MSSLMISGGVKLDNYFFNVFFLENFPQNQNHGKGLVPPPPLYGWNSYDIKKWFCGSSQCWGAVRVIPTNRPV